MIRITTLTVFCLILAGCTGLPEGAADMGSTVTAKWSAYDLETGQLLAQSTSSFDIGSGKSGLGGSFEQALIGHKSGDSWSFQSIDDPTRSFTQTRTIDVEVNRFPAVADAAVSDYESTFGKAPVVGETFPLGGYTNEVLSINGDRLSHGVIINGEQRDPADIVGAVLVSTIEDGEVVLRLEPDVGATFTIEADFSGATLLGMDVGSYRTRGINHDQLEYDFAAVTDSALVDVDVRFEVELTSVRAPTAFEGEGYGARRSPVLLGQADSVAAPAPASGHDHDDHGHQH